MIIRPRIDRHATEDQLRNLAEALVPAFGPADVLSTLEGSKGAITVASKNGIALSCFVRGILLESNSFSFASEFHRYEQLAAGQRLACLEPKLTGLVESNDEVPLRGYAALDDFRNWLIRKAA